ncbi:MAG: hypothetical protein ACFE89_09245 [Candidatus Hodarchaeota archaeon]
MSFEQNALDIRLTVVDQQIQVKDTSIKASGHSPVDEFGRNFIYPTGLYPNEFGKAVEVVTFPFVFAFRIKGAPGSWSWKHEKGRCTWQGLRPVNWGGWIPFIPFAGLYVCLWNFAKDTQMHQTMIHHCPSVATKLSRGDWITVWFTNPPKDAKNGFLVMGMNDTRGTTSYDDNRGELIIDVFWDPQNPPRLSPLPKMKFQSPI